MRTRALIYVMLAASALILAGIWMVTSRTDDRATEESSVIYTCPMHPNYLSENPGNCPICGMELVPATGSPSVGAQADTAAGERRILYWRDPMNPSYTSDTPGKAPDGMDLVPVYEDEAAGESGAIRIDPAMVQSIGVQTEKAARRALTRHLRTSATVLPDERRVFTVTTKIMGYIENLHVNYTGQAVRKGQPLFELYSPDLVSAQAEYLQIFRSKTLSGSGGLLESARQRLLNWDITPEQIAALEQRGTPQKTLTIVSPAEGLVTGKMVTEGQNVEPGMELYRIVDFSRVWVEGAVYQQDVALVSVGQTAGIELDYFPGERFTGTVTYIFPEMDRETRTLMVRLELPNPGLRIRPGMSATVSIDAVLKPDMVAVPEQSVIRTGVRTLAIVALGGGYFEPREIVTGQTAESYTQVLEGVREGEDIVVSSQFLIDSESNLRAAVRQMTAPRDGAAPDATPADSTMEGMDMGAAPENQAAAIPDAFRSQLGRVYEAYLAIQGALSADFLEGARQGSAELTAAANRIDMTLLAGEAHTAWMGQAKTIMDGASAIAAANDLESARTAFDRLSQAMIAAAREFGTPGDTALYVLHCPMAFDNRGADWLQDTIATENPYFGKTMFTCGAVTDTLK